ncbi:glycosyltransferase [Persephonella sp.]
MVEKEGNQLYLVKLASSVNYFIYSDKPKAEDVKRMFGSIKTLIREAGIVNPVAIITHPFWGNLLESLAMPVIYDYIDYHQGFKENAPHLNELEEKLFKESKLVFVTSKFLKDIVGKRRQEGVIMIPNAGEFSFFNKAMQNLACPSDLKTIRKPIIGYYGAIAEWLDVDLVEALLKAYSRYSFVFIGRVNNEKVKDLEKKYKNLHFLGEKPYKELPYYLKYFDVCLIPFKNIPLIEATDPVKLYEYLSAGKPVVTSWIPEVLKFKGLVYVSKSLEEFIKNVEKALLEQNKTMVKKRIREAKKHTWEKRVKTLERAIKKAIFPKVSIIILSYNKGELTRRCVKSIIDRSFYPNYEIIIVDNASKDKTTKKILKELEKNKRVKVIYNKKNYGFAGGNNIGMKKSTGDFLIILNNDTVITPGWISRLVYHASDKNTGLVGPVTNNIGNEAKIDLEYSNLEEMEEKAFEYISKHWGKKLELDRIAAFCWIKRREIYEKIGGFDEKFFPAFFEDDDYCLRVKKAGYKIFCAEDVFIHHELGKTSGADKDITKNKYFIINKRKFEKKWGIKWQPHKYRDNP